MPFLLSFNVTSSRFNGAVLVIQCITSPIQLIIIASSPNPTAFKTLLKIVLSFTCTTNLDFGQLLYPPFCLHHQTLSLQYIVAVYPFLLIFITYLLVTAYDREYRVLLWIWKPFKICLRHYQKMWNIRTSLIEMFATFLLLSSVKVSGVTFAILSYTPAYDITGKPLNKYYTLLDANVEYFGTRHLPFAMIALVVSFIFVLLPLLLLILYPCRCFQKCLNHCGGRCQPLHVFMDAFQGCYKTHPQDLRYFSAFYLLMRVILMLQVQLFHSSLMLYTSGILSLMGAAIIALFQPYKQHVHNKLDTESISCLTLKNVALTTTG